MAALSLRGSWGLKKMPMPQSLRLESFAFGGFDALSSSSIDNLYLRNFFKKLSLMPCKYIILDHIEIYHIKVSQKSQVLDIRT